MIEADPKEVINELKYRTKVISFECNIREALFNLGHLFKSSPIDVDEVEPQLHIIKFHIEVLRNITVIPEVYKEAHEYYLLSANSFKSFIDIIPKVLNTNDEMSNDRAQKCAERGIVFLCEALKLSPFKS